VPGDTLYYWLFASGLLAGLAAFFWILVALFLATRSRFRYRNFESGAPH
jgi:hypothetical protein